MVPFDTLNDEHKLSVLPYFFEEWQSSHDWKYFVRGLMDRERFDVLNQVRLEEIK